MKKYIIWGLLFSVIGYIIIYFCFAPTGCISPGVDLSKSDWLSFLGSYIGSIGAIIMAVLVYQQTENTNKLEKQINKMTLELNKLTLASYEPQLDVVLEDAIAQNVDTSSLFWAHDGKRYYNYWSSFDNTFSLNGGLTLFCGISNIGNLVLHNFKLVEIEIQKKEETIASKKCTSISLDIQSNNKQIPVCICVSNLPFDLNECDSFCFTFQFNYQTEQMTDLNKFSYTLSFNTLLTHNQRLAICNGADIKDIK